MVPIKSLKMVRNIFNIDILQNNFSKIVKIRPDEKALA